MTGLRSAPCGAQPAAPSATKRTMAPCMSAASAPGGAGPAASATPGSPRASKKNGTSRQWKARPASGPDGGAQRKSYVQAEPPASALAMASRWAGTRNVRSVTACPTAAPGRGPAWPRKAAASGVATPALASPSATMSAVIQSAGIQAMLNSWAVAPASRAISRCRGEAAARRGSSVTTSPSGHGAHGSVIPCPSRAARASTSCVPAPAAVTPSCAARIVPAGSCSRAVRSSARMPRRPAIMAATARTPSAVCMSAGPPLMHAAPRNRPRAAGTPSSAAQAAPPAD